MANMSSKNRFPVDSATILRAASEAAITADGASNPLALDVLSSYWDNGVLASRQQFAIVVIVTSIDRTTGDETYDFQVQVDNSTAFASPAVVSTHRLSTVGMHVIPVTREQIDAYDVDATHLRLNVDVSGTTPIIDYWAYVAPILGGN